MQYKKGKQANAIEAKAGKETYKSIPHGSRSSDMNEQAQ
jgi:hypothetical protein